MATTGRSYGASLSGGISRPLSKNSVSTCCTIEQLNTINVTPTPTTTDQPYPSRAPLLTHALGGLRTIIPNSETSSRQDDLPHNTGGNLAGGFQTLRVSSLHSWMHGIQKRQPSYSQASSFYTYHGLVV